MPGRLAGDLAGVLEPLALRHLPIRPTRPPLFVVGPPRCGTTVVYQHILNVFQFGYISNLAEEHPGSPVVYSLLTRLAAERSANYDNHRGQTSGPAGASDGWNVFERWFPRYALSPVRSGRLATELPALVGAVESMYEAPFANKNNHNSVRIGWLRRLFPRARFIHVTRDPRHATLSLRETRLDEGIEVGAWWSCPAPQFLDRPFDSQLEQSAFTTVGVDAHLERTLAELPDPHHTRVAYESFCEDPSALVDWLTGSYAASSVSLTRRETPTPDALETSSRTIRDNERLDNALERARRAVAEQ